MKSIKKTVAIALCFSAAVCSCAHGGKEVARAITPEYEQIDQSSPINVMPPYSCAAMPIPSENFVAVYVADDGRVWLKVFGDGKSDADLRKNILARALEMKREAGGPVALPAGRVDWFAEHGIVGSTLQSLGKNADLEEMGSLSGIPYGGGEASDELAVWLGAIRRTAREDSYGLEKNLREGSGWIIVANGNISFPVLQGVLDVFASSGIRKVSIATCVLEIGDDNYMGFDQTEQYLTPYFLWDPQEDMERIWVDGNE